MLLIHFHHQRKSHSKTGAGILFGSRFKDLKKNKPWIIMLVVTALIFITLAMKGGSYVYYFNNYVDETSLKNFISPITVFSVPSNEFLR
jgi:Na+/melibiose symporter-like transporter